MLKKLLALALAGVMLTSVLAGCTKSESSAQESVSTEENTDAADDTTATTDDAADSGTESTLPDISDMYDKSENMLTVNGVDINWDLFSYFVNYYTSYVAQQVGDVADWSTEYESGHTYADFVLDNALDSCKSIGAIDAGAKELGVTLTDEDRADIDEQWEDMLSSYDTPEAADAALEERGITEDSFKTILTYSALSDKCFEKLYGANGEELSDADCAEYTADDGYMMAKHILMLTTKTEEVDGQSQSVDMTDEEKAQVKEQMQGLLAQLDECAPEEIGAKFDELMNEYSEDPGSQTNPDGYLFQDGEMVSEFENSVKSLAENEYSDIVETSYGYHIILKLPINFDCVPTAYSQYAYYGYGNYTLRYLVAQDMFNSVIGNWIDSADVKTTDKLDSLDLAELYK